MNTLEYNKGWNDAIQEVQGNIRRICLGAGWGTNSDAFEVSQMVDHLELPTIEEATESNDTNRLNWLLSGDGSMVIDVDSSLDWCASRDHIDRAMIEERFEAREAMGYVGQ